MTDTGQFRAVYEATGVYERRLLPHYYHGVEDVALVAEMMNRHYGDSTAALSVVEFGCGTGRLTARLAPYARRLIVADYSPVMVDVVQSQFPQAEALCADTREAVNQLLGDGLHGAFDVVAGFWSLSYPLGEFFETMTADGVRPADDPAHARERAADFVEQLVDLLAPEGHLLALFFDADTPEQQLVTRMWERIAPFPEEGRSYTLNLLLRGLRQAEEAGRGASSHSRNSGAAWAPNRDAAVAWFNVVHFKSLPDLVNDPDVQREVTTFIDRYEQPSGGVALPSGAHVIDFHATAHPVCHLPERLR